MNGATTTAPAAPTTRVTSPEPTTTTEPEPTEYPPGVVWEQSIVGDLEGRRLSALEPTPAGWMIATNSMDPTAATPVIHVSDDATEWTRVDLPTPTGGTADVADVVYGPAGYVAVGFAAQCRPSGCPNGDGVVWVSPDAETWDVIEPPQLKGPNKVAPLEVRVIDDRYITVGRDQQDGIDQVFKVWSSDDGRSWEQTAVLDDPDWPVHRYRGLTEWDGGYVVAGTRAVCTNPGRVTGKGWVYTFAGSEAVAWSSPDGVSWEPIDLAGLGLIAPQDTVTCDINEYMADEAIAGATGTFESLDGRLFWIRGSGDIFEIDAGTGAWEPSSRTTPDALTAADIIAGTVEDDFGFVSVGLSEIDGEATVVTMTRSDDLIDWVDWSSQTNAIDPVPATTTVIAPAFIASDGTRIVVAYQAQSKTQSDPEPIMALSSTVAPIPDP